MLYNCIYSISREDNKDESPKVGETNFAASDAFPLKKDDKSLKTVKLVADDKKAVQKSMELPLSKKPIETAKKAKKEKRDGSTDSEDSDTEGKTYILINKTFIIINVSYISYVIFILQVRENQESLRNRRNLGKHQQMMINLTKVKLALVQIQRMIESIQIKIKKQEILAEPVNSLLTIIELLIINIL